MGFLGGFNWLDVLVLFALIIGLGVGYAQGMLRQMIGLAALYVGAILGAQYYTVIAGAIRFVFNNAPSRFVNALGFFAILLIVTSLINWLAFDAYRSTNLKLFPIIDHLGGSILGLITTVIVISLFLPIVTFGAAEPWPWAEQTRLLIVAGIQTSRLLPIFDLFKPGLLNALGPWLPGGLPSIFNL
ncbi:MAG: CvpA family protein [Chloroflexi bacterium]|nr:CvpA family protein [Chloroflexota bacterium]